MERSKCEDEKSGGGVKLPIGFRFHPTDEEIVLHYLKRKVWSLPLPATVIPEFQVFQLSPWDLPGDVKEKRYFFCQKRRNCMNKYNSSFPTDNGYWKSSGKNKQIMAPPGGNLVIGIKKSFVFYQGTKSPGIKTQWILHEFALVGFINLPNLTQGLMTQLGDWVVCSIYQRKKKARNQVRSTELVDRNRAGVSNDTIGNDHEFVQTSCCSGITEISCDELDQEATS